MPNYKERTQKLIQRIERENLDWMIVSHRVNVRYLSGFTGTHAILLLSPNSCIIVTDGRYQEQVQEEAPDYKAEIQGKRKDLQTVKDVLGGASSMRIGFEAEHCSFARYEQLNEAIEAQEWVPTKKWVEELRSIKDEEEILAIKKALTVAEGALQEVYPSIREGMSERELAHWIEDKMWNAGAKKESFETIALFGARSSLPHGQPSDVKLKAGDTILIDFGCVVDGYCSDITRMMFLGDPSQELIEMYGSVHLAQKNALERLQAGVSCKEADEFARQIIRDAGREDQFMHGLGHGVGLEIHEAPRLSYLSDETLQAGQVVTVEPGVYKAGVGGIRLENMAMIREHGCDILNETSTDMVIL